MKNRLEMLRKERGIKQEELANELEVSRQTMVAFGIMGVDMIQLLLMAPQISM